MLWWRERKKSLQRHTRTQQTHSRCESSFLWGFISRWLCDRKKTHEKNGNVSTYFGLSRTLHLMISCKLISHTWDGFLNSLCSGYVLTFAKSSPTKCSNAKKKQRKTQRFSYLLFVWRKKNQCNRPLLIFPNRLDSWSILIVKLQ